MSNASELIKSYLPWGLTDEEMVERSGLSLSTVRLWRRRLGVIYKGGPQPITDEEKATIISLLEEGWPASEIALRIHRSVYMVKQIGTSTGLVSQNGNAHAGMLRWANKHHPILFAEIQSQPIEDD